MEQLESRVDAVINRCECDAVLAFGVDNFNYLTQTVLPFAWHYPTRRAAALFPKNGRPVVTCPLDWSEAVKDQDWIGEIVPQDEALAVGDDAVMGSLTKIIRNLELEGKTIGVDTSRITKSLMDSLMKQFPSVKWVPVDAVIRELRLIKTSSEVSYIEKACKQADRGIVYALMHLEGTVDNPGYTISEFTERIRVHINENGASGVGLLNTAFGTECQIYYTPQRGWVKEGDLFRMDVSSEYLGYWANVGRMGVTGSPTAEQEAAYRDNLRLRASALETLKPGVACNEVYTQVVRAAEKQGIAFWKEVGIGHGVGASHHEPPYLNLSDGTELKEGMVIALDIFTYGPRQELIHSKDIYHITEGGHRKLSWYRDWKELYEVTGFRATH
jgi:Xaa-Pro dipeptidase